MIRIDCQNISKYFFQTQKKNESILSKVISLITGKQFSRTKVTALDSVSFSVKSREVVGIIGHNGSGKSTLLRVIAGIYKQNNGTIKTSGKLISVIGLASGLKPKMSVKKNIILCCALNGMKDSDITKNIKPILAFSELEKYEQTPLYQLSSGMTDRLLYSMVVHCKPKILLLDEMFEVGDIKFRDKILKTTNELVKNGASVIFVSHDLDSLKRFCNRFIWLHKGQIKKQGDSSIITDYEITMRKNETIL